VRSPLAASSSVTTRRLAFGAGLFVVTVLDGLVYCCRYLAGIVWKGVGLGEGAMLVGEVSVVVDSLVEWFNAPDLSSGPKGHGFKSHHYHNGPTP
jgi:hypothetical protein